MGVGCKHLLSGGTCCKFGGIGGKQLGIQLVSGCAGGKHCVFAGEFGCVQ